MDRHSAVYRLVMVAVMTAVLEAAKFALNAIPNVELISLLLMVFTTHFGWKDTMNSALLFAVIESIWWGISIWTITYFYVWPLLVLICSRLDDSVSVLFRSFVLGLFGLLFGLLCTFPTLLTAGLSAAVAWWIAGIPFDLIHGVSNFVLCLLLYRPLVHALARIRKARASED